MMSSFTSSMGIFLVLLLLGGCFAADLEVKGNVDAGVGLKKPVDSVKNNTTLSRRNEGSNLDLDAKKGEKLKKGNHEENESKVGDGNNLGTRNSSKEVGAKESESASKSKAHLSEGSKENGRDEQKEKVGGGSETKEVINNGESEDNGINSKPLRKEGPRREECDPSNMCTDEEDKFVACLRVPGNESPHLSLLIQNKGKSSLNITISAPKFVELEKTEVQLPEKEDKKVKVSIGKGGTNNLIVLKAGHGKCSLDFRDLVPHSSSEQPNSYFKFASFNFPTRAPAIAFISFAALLVLATVYMCMSFRKRHLAGGDSKYQKLEMELPVTGGLNKVSDNNDGWDDNWDDSWGDEEAPATPSMAVTPNLSSKGLASRRLNKEGWKD